MPIVKTSLHSAKVHQYAALISGQQQSPMHGDCASPVYLELQGDEDANLARLRQWDQEDIDFAPGHGLIGAGFRPGKMATGYASVRCRKCQPCLLHRARLWAARARSEIAAANRTWFGTLTYRPIDRFRVRCEADQKASMAGVRWSSLNASEQFAEMAKVVRRDHQLFLKRVRKQTGARIRYLTATEAHSDGFPHLHILLHEYAGSATKRSLEGQWLHGISHWRLVDGADHRVPWYVTKYLTKSVLARPLASQRYGQPPIAALTERVHEVARLLSTLRRNDPPAAL